MKRFNVITGIITTSFVFSLHSLVFADDAKTTKTENKEQVKVVEKTQVTNEIQHGKNFVDVNGDGYNDNAPDADGDGIPNGQDPDFQGAKNRAAKTGTPRFVDENGDGINDNAMSSGNAKNRKGGNGPGDGTGNKGIGPKDGTGYGPGAKSGNCDGTGPKGKGQRGSKK